MSWTEGSSFIVYQAALEVDRSAGYDGREKVGALCSVPNAESEISILVSISIFAVQCQRRSMSSKVTLAGTCHRSF